jgi:hypothetical protein
MLTISCGQPAPPTATEPPAAELLPGRPYDSAAILEAMRASRRPGGVPNQLETDEIAAAVAETVWTIDGQPWTAMSIGGSCGGARCTLDVSGSHFGAPGEDLWALEVVPASGEVLVLESNLRSMPAELVANADHTAREAVGRIEAGGLQLVAAGWVPPPDYRYVLSYRSGDEEGSCELEVVVDASTREVETRSDAGC